MAQDQETSMFGVGPQEMAVIALFALIIFGPGKLPEVMREAGKHYKKFKGMADEMTGELNKVTAEARRELDGALGDLGPMGADLEKSLGMNKSTRSTSGNRNTTTTGTKSASASSTAKKTTSTTSSRSTTTSASKTTAAKKNATATAAANKTATAAPKPLVATKEDPLADFALFEGEKKETKRRARSATPSAITDLTPRAIYAESEPEVAEKSPLADITTSDDPVARARARRRTAGYARA
jgi:TatA/E family protein of Tat protein translocase